MSWDSRIDEESFLIDSYPTEILRDLLTNFTDHETLQRLAVIPRHARVPRGSLIRTILEIYRDAQTLMLAWNPPTQVAIAYLRSVNHRHEGVEELGKERLILRVLNVAYARMRRRYAQ